MPVKKRLTETQRRKLAAKRLAASLPKGWRNAVAHPIIVKLADDKHDYTKPAAVSEAIQTVSTWRGADYTDKVFVLALDIIMERAYGTPVLEPETYNRLWDHLYNNEHKMFAAGLNPWQTYMWDVYHDHYKLSGMEPGDLILPNVVRKVKLKRRLQRK